MKKAVIVLNGESCRYDFDGSFVVCCDAALNYLNNIGVKPDLILGDFDSLGFVPENAEIFPAEKDYTDGELALMTCLEKGFESVDFICAGGGRDDHFLGNLALLRQAFDKGLDARLFTRYSVMRICSDTFTEDAKVGATISVIALEKTVVEKSRGLKYVYAHTTLLPTMTLGISNVATEESVSIDFESGVALVIVNR